MFEDCKYLPSVPAKKTHTVNAQIVLWRWEAAVNSYGTALLLAVTCHLNKHEMVRTVTCSAANGPKAISTLIKYAGWSCFSRCSHTDEHVVKGSFAQLGLMFGIVRLFESFQVVSANWGCR